MRFSQSEDALLSNLQNIGEKDKESSLEWLANTDPGWSVVRIPRLVSILF